MVKNSEHKNAETILILNEIDFFLIIQYFQTQNQTISDTVSHLSTGQCQCQVT